MVQVVITLAVGLPLGIHFGPTEAFVFLATILTGVMISIYIVFNLSCLCYYLRRARSEFNVLLHVIIPVLGILAFMPGLVHRAGPRRLVAEVRRAPVLPGQRDRPGHRDLVRARDRGPGLRCTSGTPTGCRK